MLVGSFIHAFIHFINFIHNSTLDYIYVHMMFCSCEVSSLVLSVHYGSKGYLTIYVISYIFIDKNRLGGVGKGRVVGWLVV